MKRFKQESATAVIIAGNNNVITSCNRAAAKIFEYPQRLIIGQKISNFLPPADDEKINLSGLRKKLLTKGSIALTGKLKRRSGEMFLAYVEVSVVDSGKENNFCFAVIVEDLTRNESLNNKCLLLQKNVKGLRKSENNFRQLAESLHEGVFLVDLEKNKLLYVNKSYKYIIGRSAQALKNDPFAWLKWVHENDKENITADLRRGGPKDIIRDFRVVKADGKIAWLHAHFVYIKNRGGRPIRMAGTMSDITEQKKHERELAAKRRQLLAQKKSYSDFMDLLEVSAGSLNFIAGLSKIMPIIGRTAAADCIIVNEVNEEKGVMTPINNWGFSREELVYYLSLEQSFRRREFMSLFQHNSIFISNFNASTSKLSGKFIEILRRLRIQSMKTIPLVCDKRLVMQIIVLFKKKKIFTPEDENVTAKIRSHLEASFLADRNAETLLNKTLRLARQLEVVEAMSGIDRKILRSSSKEGVIFGSLELFDQAVKIDCVEVLEYDADRRLFTLAAIKADGKTSGGEALVFSEADIQSWPNIMFGIPAYYSDFTKEPPLNAYEKRFTAREYQSLMLMPLLSKGELIGALGIAGRHPAAINPNEIKVIRRLADQISVALSNINLVDELKDLLIGVVKSLATALDAKSAWTKGHSARVSETALKLGRALGLKEEKLFQLRLAALFHDIGKIGVFDMILNKSGRLSDSEMSAIKRHPVKTYEILAPISQLAEVARCAKHHHERWDGSGYPDGLVGQEIPYLSRIIAAADSYDAMIMDRPYRKAMGPEEVIKELAAGSGSQFDPDITTVFIDTLKKKAKKAA